MKVLKSSLVTAIRIIQEDNIAQVNQNSKNNPWIKVTQKTKKAKRPQKQSKSKKVDNNITPTNLHAEEQSEFTEIQSDHRKSDNSNNQRANNRPQNAKESNPTNVVIAGDSIIKHINAHKLSKADTKVWVTSFPGCTTLDMDDYIKPILRRKPDKLILHVGTNSLKGRDIPCHRGLTMANLNINSLVRNIDQLRIFMSSTNIDILCINETKCDSSISDHEVCLPGFELVRKDRSVNGRRGGGICIYSI